MLKMRIIRTGIEKLKCLVEQKWFKKRFAIRPIWQIRVNSLDTKNVSNILFFENVFFTVLNIDEIF